MLSPLAPPPVSGGSGSSAATCCHGARLAPRSHRDYPRPSSAPSHPHAASPAWLPAAPSARRSASRDASRSARSLPPAAVHRSTRRAAPSASESAAGSAGTRRLAAVAADAAATGSGATGADVAGRLSAEEREAVGSADVAIITNGPGEVAAWVTPVVASLQRVFGCHESMLRVSVLLAPCPHASGGELALLQAMPHVHRCSPPAEFLNMLLFTRPAAATAAAAAPAAPARSADRERDDRAGAVGKAEGQPEKQGETDWGWRRKGVVVFLGGDQFNAVLLAWRLGYRCLVYAEDAVRWPWLADLTALRSPLLLPQVPPAVVAAGRARVVGDLFLAAVGEGGGERRGEEGERSEREGEGGEGEMVVGLLPGSKDVKLMIGVPFLLSVAHHLHHSMGARVRFILPLAPTVSPASLARFASPHLNPLIARHHWQSARLLLPDGDDPGPGEGGGAVGEAGLGGKEAGWEYVGTLVCGEAGGDGGEGGSERDGGGDRETDGRRGERVEVEVWRAFPSYTLLSHCSLALTTVGTNTAELAALGVPMVVLLPSQSFELFRGAGGLLGLVPSLLPAAPAAAVTRLLNAALLRSLPFLSWPNRWAGRQVVPELVGEVGVGEVAAAAAHLLSHPAELEAMRQDLREVTALYGGGGKVGGTGDGEEGGGGGAADAIAREVLKLLLL